jgi:hypothetical protein
MDGDRTVTAAFDPLPAATYTLTVDVSGDGLGTVTGSGINCGSYTGPSEDCSQEYAAGTQVTLTATPDSGSTFGGWSECDSTSENGNQCQVTMNGDRRVAATFNLSPTEATGRVVNAVDAAPISGATVGFDGIATTTAANGTFLLSLPAGTYDVTVSAPDFISATFSDVVIPSGETTDLGTIALSTEVEPGETRIVLTWGETPADLDAHLTGPIEDSDDRFHIYWAEENRGSLDASPFAFLDIDDTTSFGPETITITAQFPGVYRYSVHNYTNREATESTALAQSGAAVRVFRGDSEIAQFAVPNQEGTLWTVFEMSGVTIAPVNAMSYHTDPPSTIQSLAEQPEGRIQR